ncbi:DUF4062 domain-containing protein [Christensenella tenuis]|uniref:DUF4062 domain-containing protein n=1 Tax=Christensenella tenuis TaxID=2763033 RepID=A0ABR7EDI8_9FIRM|nr:DUF4062 domain-containing protein [Christensenella tenuis]MBC5647850.1 DUF4062 domain-containing protein [Christensenella tenuis]
MSNLKVFVSSTCYDLKILRDRLRSFIESIGYEPIMSEYSDLLYDPREHTHVSCINEVPNCDMVLLIIGSRFGGKCSTDALKKIDFESLKDKSRSTEILDEKDKVLSITQAEVLRAIQASLPIYTFVEEKLWHNHEIYEKNKDSHIIDEMIFPSIAKPETAKYIFEFINFIRARNVGNTIYPFDNINDIEDVLRKQWANYFQRLLWEERNNRIEHNRTALLSEQLEDLKTAILTTIQEDSKREVAMGVVRFRRLSDVLVALKYTSISKLKKQSSTWKMVLKEAGVQQIIDYTQLGEERSRGFGTRCILVMADKTVYQTRFSKDMLDDLESDWEDFKTLKEEDKVIVLDTLFKNQNSIMRMMHKMKSEDAQEILDLIV